MFIGRAELLPEDETVQEHQTAKEEEAVLLSADRAGPGLFKGAFLGLGLEQLQRQFGRGILDPGDNVRRCPECHWELEDGECTQCGFHEFDVSGSDSDSDDGLGSLGESIDLDESEMDDDEDLDNDFGTTVAGHAFNHHPYNDASRIPTFSDDDSDDDDETNSMRGFIDHEALEGDSGSDGDTESTMTIYNRNFEVAPYDHADHNSVSSQISDPPTDYGDNNSVSSYMSHSDHNPVQPYVDLRAGLDPYSTNGASTTNGDDSDAGTNYDEMTEDSDTDATPAPATPRRQRGGITRVILSSDDEDEDYYDNADGVGAQDDNEDNEDGAHQVNVESPLLYTDHTNISATEPSNHDSTSDYDSEESDDSIRPPQSSNHRRQHLNNQRARRGNHDIYPTRGTNPPLQQYPPRPLSRRGRGSANRYHPYQTGRSFGRRIPVGGGNRGYPA